MTGALRRVQPDRGLNVNRGAMLRRLVTLIVLLLACALAQAQPLAVIPPLTGPVIDTTMTLDAATKQQLEAQALALQQRKGSQLQVLIIPSTQPEDIAQYAVRVYDEYKLGRKGTNDGVLLVVAKDDRRAWIATGYGLEGAIPDATAFRVIQEYLLPKFRAGDFDGGVTDATAALVKLIDGEALPAPMVKERRQGKGSGFLFALFAAFIVAQIARAFLNPVPSFLRGIIGGAAAGGVAWLLSSVLVAGGIGALIGFFVGLASLPSGRYASDRGWGGFGGGGGGGWGGGGFGGGGGGGGGWSGGGGMTGGGGAGGSW